MVRKRLLALMGSLTIALSLVAAPAAFAQDQGDTSGARTTSGDQQPPTETVLPGRVGGDRAERRRRAPTPPTPEQNKAAAQALLTGANVGCQVMEATQLGVTAEQKTTYEAICASGPGFLAVQSEPVQTYNCLELASTAVVLRERDPNADVGQQCTLPANTQTTPFVAAYAREAGVTCTVDQGIIAGKSTTNNLIYEVGCADTGGYWIEKTAAGWDVSPCYDLVLQEDRCRFTTETEIAATWKAMLAGSAASNCDLAEARRVGRDAQGLGVYEVKCVSGEGYFARLTAQNTAQRVQTCAEAVNVAGGCKLTTVAAAPAAAPATPQQ